MLSKSMDTMEFELGFLAVAYCAVTTPTPPVTPTRAAHDTRTDSHDSRVEDADDCWLALVPDDALLLALSHVNCAAEHSRVAATCRRLRRLMRDGTRVRSLFATARLRRLPESATRNLLRRLCGGGQQGCLTHLDLSGVGLRSLERLSALRFPRLDGLTLHKCAQLAELSGIAQLAPALTKLDLSGCTAIASLEGLGGLTSLRALSVTGCAAISNWLPLANCSLELLECAECAGLSDASMPHIALPTLTALDISGCTRLTTTRPLQTALRLTKLRAIGCLRLRRLHGLTTSLQSLQLRDCVTMTSLAPLRRCTKLQLLYLDGCRTLSSVRGLERCVHLRTLSLCGCEALSSLGPIATSPLLETVDAAGCIRLSQNREKEEEERRLEQAAHGPQPQDLADQIASACASGMCVSAGVVHIPVPVPAAYEVVDSGDVVGLREAVNVLNLPSPLKRKIGLLRNALSTPPSVPLYCMWLGAPRGGTGGGWPAAAAAEALHAHAHYL